MIRYLFIFCIISAVPLSVRETGLQTVTYVSGHTAAKPSGPFYCPTSRFRRPASSTHSSVSHQSFVRRSCVLHRFSRYLLVPLTRFVVFSSYMRCWITVGVGCLLAVLSHCPEGRALFGIPPWFLLCCSWIFLGTENQRRIVMSLNTYCKFLNRCVSTADIWVL